MADNNEKPMDVEEDSFDEENENENEGDQTNAGEAGKDGEQKKKGRKRKRIIPFHKIKAHKNPLSDSNIKYPISPAAVDWTKFYPKIDSATQHVEFADIGCGFGGLLISLSKIYPDNFSMGLEIRPKAVEYVQDRIDKMRKREEGFNIAVVQTNAMKYLPNYFKKGQLKKMFFLFQDPHFKKKNEKRRIISTTLLAEYAYLMAVGGRVYIITDVKELFDWEYSHLKKHPLFQEVLEKDYGDDKCVDLIQNATEEGRKVTREAGSKWFAVFTRVEDPYLTQNNTSS